MRRAMRRFARLPAKDKLFFINALFLAGFLRVYLNLFGFNNTIKLLSLFHTETDPEKNQIDKMERYRKSIALCYYFAPYINCLAICTAHWWLMKRQGIPVYMKFGMRKQDEKLAAHAWLEYNGEPLSPNESIKNMFAAFETSIL